MTHDVFKHLKIFSAALPARHTITGVWFLGQIFRKKAKNHSYYLLSFVRNNYAHCKRLNNVTLAPPIGQKVKLQSVKI